MYYVWMALIGAALSVATIIVTIVIVMSIPIFRKPLVLWVRKVITDLAKRDRLFTFVKEGEIRHIDKGGSLHRMIIRVVGKDIKSGDKPEAWKTVNKPTDPTDPEKFFWWKWWLWERELESIGIYWIGFPPFTLYTYEFEWNSQAISKEDGSTEIRHRKEVVDSDRYEYTYGVEVPNVEITGSLKARLVFNLLLRADRPYITRLRDGKWFSTNLQAIVSGAVSQFCQNKTFAEIQASQKLDATDPTSILPLIWAQKRKILEQTGKLLIHLDFFAVELEKDEEVEKAVQSAELSRLKGVGVVNEAKARAKAIALVGKAKANAARQLVEAGTTPLAVATAIADGVSAHQGPLSIGGNGMGMMVDTTTRSPAPPPAKKP